MNKHIFLSLGFVLLLGACSSAPSLDQFSNLDNAKLLYDKNTDKPIYAQYYARSLLTHGRTQDAFKMMTFATKTASYTPQQQIDAYLLMADIHSALDHPDQQEAFIKQALAIQPRSLKLNMTLTNFYHKAERYNDAQRIYDDLIYSCKEHDFGFDGFITLVESSVLNLIAMDEFQDAQHLILWAKEQYPSAVSLERNLRITRGLLQSHGHNAPKPDYKPDI